MNWSVTDVARVLHQLGAVPNAGRDTRASFAQ
jgi:hypothetical protein